MYQANFYEVRLLVLKYVFIYLYDEVVCKFYQKVLN